jgi:hypothetical protein
MQQAIRIVTIEENQTVAIYNNSIAFASGSGTNANYRPHRVMSEFEAKRKTYARTEFFLISAGVNVSVYNLPKCVLSRSVWPYALQSISDRKNGFVEECDRCDEKNSCGGFFTTDAHVSAAA